MAQSSTQSLDHDSKLQGGGGQSEEALKQGR